MSKTETQSEALSLALLLRMQRDSASGVVTHNAASRAAAELEWLDAENKALRARLEIDPSHPIDGIAARDETIRQLEAQMRALLGEIDAFALVPKEPSDAMRRAAQKADHDHSPHAEWLEDEWRGLRRIWVAMLAAAKTGDAA